jgi:hypothetical protein
MKESLKAELDKTIMVICGLFKDIITMHNKKTRGFGRTVWID